MLFSVDSMLSFSDNIFFKYVQVLIAIYIAQTFFKLSAVRKTGEFDWKELLYGMLDYALYFCGILILFYGGSLIPDVAIIPMVDKTLNITDALTLMAYALIIIQAKKCIDNIRETFEIDDDAIKDAQSQVVVHREIG